jgi:hypothetical protein
MQAQARPSHSVRRLTSPENAPAVTLTIWLLWRYLRTRERDQVKNHKMTACPPFEQGWDPTLPLLSFSFPPAPLIKQHSTPCTTIQSQSPRPTPHHNPKPLVRKAYCRFGHVNTTLSQSRLDCRGNSQYKHTPPDSCTSTPQSKRRNTVAYAPYIDICRENTNIQNCCIGPHARLLKHCCPTPQPPKL